MQTFLYTLLCSRADLLKQKLKKNMKKELKKAILTLAMENIKKDEKLKIHLNKDNNLTTDKSLFFHGILTKYNADDLEKFISDLSDNFKIEELN